MYIQSYLVNELNMVFKNTPTVLIFISIFVLGTFADVRVPKVKTPLGLVQGIHELSYDGRTFSAFYGIPYAQVPVGELRFKDPVAKNAWPGIWKANNTYECLQIFTHIDSFDITGDEDCLYVNVFVPKEDINAKDNLDVIVHIHGGAFMFGSQDLYAGPAFLMDRDVILVNLNYRLGPFGFLSTEDDVVSGNMGLKDQTMALKWIQENIASFGGNPNSVTITGMSAGGASVHFHYFSQLSKGLFHKGISLSGSALVPWALQENALEKSKQLASNLCCLSDKSDKMDTKEIVKCMRDRSARQVIEALLPFYTYKVLPFAPFGPVIEKESESAFISELPYKSLQREGGVADLPWLTTLNTEEGIYPVGYVYDYLDEINERWNELMPKVMDYENTVSKSKMDSVSQALRQFYLKGEALSNKTVHQFVTLNSHRHFVIGGETAAKMQAKINKQKVWFYMFGYRGKVSLTKTFGCEEDLGVSHGDDVFYVFQSDLNPGKQTKEDNRMKDQMVDLFVSFSKYGEPAFKGLTWAPVTQNEFRYLFISGPENANIEKAESLYPNFWNDLPIEEGPKYISMQKDEL